MKYYLISFGTVAALAIIILLDQVACVRDIALAMTCEKHLRSAHPILVEYGSEHGEYPMTQNGNLDFEAVLTSSNIHDAAEYCCSTDNNPNCYVFLNELTPADLGIQFKNDSTEYVIAIDNDGNHPQSQGNFRTSGDFHVNMLFNNSGTYRRILTPNEHRRLIAKLNAGEHFGLDDVNTKY